MFSFFRRKTAIGDLTVGMTARVIGTVACSRPLTIPESTTRCAMYEKLNESFDRPSRGRGRRMWFVNGHECRSAGFFLQQENRRVWVQGDAEDLQLRGGHPEAAVVGKKENRRYTAHFVREGDLVEVTGTVAAPRGAEPGDCLVLCPDGKGRLIISVKKLS